MADFPGTIIGTSIASGIVAGPAKPPKRTPADRPVAFVVPGLQSGPLSVNRPLTPAHADLHGSIVTSFVDTFYNRFYFLPATLDFAAISADVRKPVLVWNAYFNPTTINGTLVTSDGSVQIPQDPKGTTLQGLQTLNVDISTTAAGAPSLNGSITFSITPPIGGQTTVSFGVIGTRARFLPFSPNLESPYKVRYEFLTEVLTSRDGHEQAFAMRDEPRKFLDYQVLHTSGAEVRQAKALMTSWRGRTFVLPEWSRFAVSSLGMASAQARLTLDAVPSWLFVGQSVALSQQGLYGMRTVKAIQGNDVVFAESDDQTWSRGVLLCPMLSGNFPDKLTSQRVTDGVQDLNVQFEVAVGVNPLDDVGQAGEMYEGLEILMTRPNEGAEPSLDTSFPAIVVDQDTGRLSRFTPIDFPIRGSTATFSSMTLDETQALLQFWLRHKGRALTFYLPTWDNDLPPVLDLYYNDYNMRVQYTDVLNFYQNSTVFKTCVVELYSGERIYRRVKSLEQVDQDTLIKFTDTWYRDIKLAEIKRVSWLTVARFARDDVEFEYVTRHYVDVQLSFVTLLNEQV